MDATINWLNGLSRKTKTVLVVAVAIFTPVVGIVFTVVFWAIGAAFSLLSLVLGFVNWGVATPLILVLGSYKAYQWAKNNSWNLFQ